MDQDLQIKTPDGKTIIGQLGYVGKRPEALVVLSHGLAGNEDWPPLLQAYRHFKSCGFAAAKINFHHWDGRARKLHETCISQCAEDLRTTVNDLKNRGFEQVFLVGHSFGGLVVLRAQIEEARAVSLWDPTSALDYPADYFFQTGAGLGQDVLEGGMTYLAGTRYRSDLKELPNELEMIKELGCPVQICFADGPKGVLKRSSRRYFEAAKGDKELVAVPDASHCFVEEDAERLLLRKTSAWFQRFLT